MKRSEAVKLINDYLRAELWKTPEQVKKYANELLTKLEEAGMLPPCFEFSNGDGLHTWKDCKDAYEIDGDFKWEAE